MKAKDLFLIAAIALLVLPDFKTTKFSFAMDKYENLSSEGMVAMQSANTKFDEVSPDKVIPVPICNCCGTGKVKSGDGIIDIPCPCGDNCKCSIGDVDDSDASYTVWFTAKWCGPCVQFARDEVPTFERAGWKFGKDRWSKGVNIVKVDVDDDRYKLRDRFEPGDMMLPRFVVVRRGKKVDAISGYHTFKQLSKFHNDTITKARQ